MNAFPLAGRREVRTWLWWVATRNRAAFAGMAALFLAATVAGLAGPRLLGELVDAVARGTAQVTVDLLGLAFIAVLVLRSGLRLAARFTAAVFGERMLAEAREDLVRHAVGLPLDAVESAGTGELLGRATSDVDKLDEGLRQAAPEIAIALVMAGLTAVAMVLTSPLLAAGALVAVPVLVVATRWYRPRAVAAAGADPGALGGRALQHARDGEWRAHRGGAADGRTADRAPGRRAAPHRDRRAPVVPALGRLPGRPGPRRAAADRGDPAARWLSLPARSGRAG